MQEQQTWRTLLGTLIKDSSEKQRVASELGVNPLSVTRWVEKKSTPRPESLHRLLDVFPRQRQLLLSLIIEEFPEFSSLPMEGESLVEEIPSAFYNQVVSMILSLPQEQVVWSTCQLILQHALEQIDPHHQSVALLITQCVPPLAGKKVRSLQSSMGMGISPWGGNVQHQSILLGADTVPGQVIASGRPIIVQDFRDPRQIGNESKSGIISSCTYPLMRADHVAGTFGAVSTLPDYFLPSRQVLIQDYAKLISLAFPLNAFYNIQDIELQVMPFSTVQLPYIATLQKRIQELVREGMKHKEFLTYRDAEQRVWQQLEEELLHMALVEDSQPSL